MYTGSPEKRWPDGGHGDWRRRHRCHRLGNCECTRKNRRSETGFEWKWGWTVRMVVLYAVACRCGRVIFVFRPPNDQTAQNEAEWLTSGPIGFGGTCLLLRAEAGYGRDPCRPVATCHLELLRSHSALSHGSAVQQTNERAERVFGRRPGRRLVVNSGAGVWSAGDRGQRSGGFGRRPVGKIWRRISVKISLSGPSWTQGGLLKDRTHSSLR